MFVQWTKKNNPKAGCPGPQCLSGSPGTEQSCNQGGIRPRGPAPAMAVKTSLWGWPRRGGCSALSLAPTSLLCLRLDPNHGTRAGRGGAGTAFVGSWPLPAVSVERSDSCPMSWQRIQNCALCTRRKRMDQEASAEREPARSCQQAQ